MSEEDADLEVCAQEWEAELEALKAIFAGEEGALQVLEGADGEEHDGGTAEHKGSREPMIPRRIRLNCEVRMIVGLAHRP